MGYDAIWPGRVWLDTEGKRIQAHGGSVLYEKGTFYWYGENKEKTRPGNGILHWGVKCYSSRDLYNWKDEGLIVPPAEDMESPLHPSSKAERPHIIFHEHSQKYICWMKVIRNGVQRAIVLTAENLLGPYTLVREEFCPAGRQMGDFDLVKTEDGKGFLYFECPHKELVCAELTEDYMDVTDRITVHFPYGHPPVTREAPAFFSRRGNLYLFTSGTTGYHPNPTETAQAWDYHGPWNVVGTTHPEDGSMTSYNSQISCVFRHPGKRDLYIAMADRWMPKLRELDPDGYDRGKAYERIRQNFEWEFSGDPTLRAKIEWLVPPPDTSQSDYVWLPVSFERDVPTIHWVDRWRVEDFL